MPPTESEVRQAIQKFDTAIYAIRDANFPEISAMAGRCVELIAPGPQHAIDTVANMGHFYSPAITGFDLAPIPGKPTPQFSSVIVLDMGKLAGSLDQASIQGDLVRTIAIAVQYPFLGYQRRLRDVYGEALDRQAGWLEAKDTPEIAFDPRNQDRETLLLQLLGKAQYYTDFGFSDWQKGVDEYLATNPAPAVRRKLVSTRDDMSHFISGRKMFGKMQYEMALKGMGYEYLRLSVDERAGLAALNSAMIAELGQRPM